jgi:hypothetical protein
MSFSEAVSQMPAPIRLWVLWLTIAMIVTPVLLAPWRATRRDAVIIAVASMFVIAGMYALHATAGFVRLLGLVHVVVWTPLAVHLARRLRRGRQPITPRIVTGIFLVSICLSLVFDYVDVARWLLGDRAPMVAAGA